MGTKAAQTKSHTQKPLISITRLRPSVDAYDLLGEYGTEPFFENFFRKSQKISLLLSPKIRNL
jgi:hypothetical protein